MRLDLVVMAMGACPPRSCLKLLPLLLAMQRVAVRACPLRLLLRLPG